MITTFPVETMFVGEVCKLLGGMDGCLICSLRLIHTPTGEQMELSVVHVQVEVIAC